MSADLFRVAFGRSVFTATFLTFEDAANYLDKSVALDLACGRRPKDNDRMVIIRGTDPVQVRFAVLGQWIIADMVVDA
jgi:hypothetical protein